jgi:hypothetical protein
MKTTHELTFSKTCPLNDSIDNYKLTVETDRMVKVEDILAAIAALPEKEYQEKLTEQLARRLEGCRIEVMGYHSGVKTTCKV